MRTEFDLPPGLVGDDTIHSAKGRWAAANGIRWRQGRGEVEGGFESLTTTLLTGVCRGVLAWTDNLGVLDAAFGTTEKLQVWRGGEVFDITPYGPAKRLGLVPFSVTNTSATVTVTDEAHGYTTGDSLKIQGSADTGGIAAADLDGIRTITVVDDDSYTFTADDTATSTTTGGGSGVIVTPQSELPEGAVNGTGSVGYGTGAYGVGPWGETSETADYFPRTWSLGAWGQQLLASPRNGGLYLWENDTSERAAVVDNAPTQISYMLVAPLNGGYQAFALGTQEETSGVFNPMCIRHSSIRDLTEWSTSASGSTAREYVLTGGGRIVAGRMCGPYMLVWTNDSLFLGTFVGALNQPWRFDRVGRNCGLIGPNAAVIVGQRAFWASPDRQFYSYAVGGEPVTIPCPIRTDYAEHLTASQDDKVVASTCTEFNEVRWDYPDSREGYENSRYLRLVISGPDAGAWSQGEQARTFMLDAGPSAYPIGVTAEGNVYYHERGFSADGASRSWFLRSAMQLLDEDWRLVVKSLRPDFKDQMGPINCTVTAYEHPQDEDPTVYVSEALAAGQPTADIWVSGRYFTVEFSGSGAVTHMRLGTPVFETELAGKAL